MSNSNTINSEIEGICFFLEKIVIIAILAFYMFYFEFVNINKTFINNIMEFWFKKTLDIFSYFLKYFED